MLSEEQKRERFYEFYLIAHPIKANVIKVDNNQSDLAEQSMAEFEHNMPYAFKIAGEMAQIQSQSLKPLRNMGDKVADLITYLEFQSKKIDLMMSYILQQQDEPQHQANAIKFGGGGAVVVSNIAENIGETHILKLFVESEAAAVFCYAEVIEIEHINDEYHVSYLYTHIREEDQELLVRASLHLQTQILRKQQLDMHD